MLWGCALRTMHFIFFVLFFSISLFSELGFFFLVCGNMLHCFPAGSPSRSCLPVLLGLLLVVLMQNPKSTHTCKRAIQSRTRSPAAPSRGLATSSPGIVLANSDLAQGRVFMS